MSNRDHWHVLDDRHRVRVRYSRREQGWVAALYPPVKVVSVWASCNYPDAGRTVLGGPYASHDAALQAAKDRQAMVGEPPQCTLADIDRVRRELAKNGAG